MKELVGILGAVFLVISVIVATGPHWMITTSRIDAEGYPEYSVWKNFMPYAVSSSRSQAEWYTLSEAEKKDRLEAPYKRGWSIAKTRSDLLRDGTYDETWAVWTPKEYQYFKSEAAAKAYVQSLGNGSR